MANPLMPGILNNTLHKEGKTAGPVKDIGKTAHYVNLKSEQEKLLTENLLKHDHWINKEARGGTQRAGISMVTLEELRGTKQQSEVPAQQPASEPVECKPVSLVSIGKLYNKTGQDV